MNQVIRVLYRSALIVSVLSVSICIICRQDPAGGSPASVQNRPLLEPQLGHGEIITRVVFSPDGRTIATSSRDGTVILSDVAAGQARQTLRAYQYDAWDVTFSRNSRLVVSGGVNSIIVWDSSTGAMLKKHEVTTSGVFSVALSPDEKKLASGHEDGTVTLWDANTWKELNRVKAHSNRVRRLAFTPDGKALVSQDEDGVILLWDGTSQRLIKNKGGGPVFAASPNGRLLAWRSMDEITATLSDGNSLRALKGHSKPVHSVAFSSDGRWLASASADPDTAIIIWEAATGKAAAAFKHQGTINEIAFSPDGRTLASSSGKDLILWDLAKGEPRWIATGRITQVDTVSFGTNGSALAVGLSGGHGTVIWNTATGEALQKLDGGNGIFSPDSRLVAINRGNVFLVDANTWKEQPPLQGTKGVVRCIAFSSDSRMIAGADEDYAIILWDIGSRKVLKRLAGHTKWVEGVAFSPDGRMLASGGAEPDIRLWDTSSGTLVKRFTMPSATRVAFSPTGRVLAAAGGNAIFMWNLVTGAQQELRGGTFQDFAFSPDGTTLAAATQQGTVMLWNVATGKELGKLTAGTNFVNGVALSPDGSKLVAGSADGTVRVWDARNGFPLATLVCIDDGKDWLAATPFGFYDSSEGAAGLVRWRIGTHLYPVEAFELNFHRSDLVQKSLRGEPLVATRPDVQRFASGQAIPPQVTFVSPHDGQEVTGDQLDIQVTASDDRDVKGVVFFINGRPIAAKPIPTEAKPIPTEAKPIAIEAKPIPTSHKIFRQFQVTVPLPPGETTLTLKAVAYDDEGLQAWDVVRITHKGAAPVVGDLYVFAFGISRYQNPKYNLKYAAADAQAFASLWKRTEGVLYRRVIVTGLTDAQATSGNIRTALSKLIDTATEKDSVALFLSGHGVLQQGEDGETYYFATHEIDPTNKAALDQTALPWTVLQETLARVRAKRMLMFLDACHSGSTLGGTQASNDRLARLLAKSGGVMVFASSRGSQYSYELDDLKHGAFTAALMEGIGEGKADAGQRDGNITPAELLAYLQDRVPQLTGNQQMPACPFMSDFGEPFPLARVK